MFCFQCEQTRHTEGCQTTGVCGKDEETAELQDLLVHAAKGMAQYAAAAGALGQRDRAVDRGILDALFLTVTNVSFDPGQIGHYLARSGELRDQARVLYAAAGGTAVLTGPATWEPASTLEALRQQGRALSLAARFESVGKIATGLQELVLYGIKGAAAYAHHAQVLGFERDEIYAGFAEALAFLSQNPTDIDALLGWALRTGEINLQIMELLDCAHTTTYGHPTPTSVRVTPVAGKCIAVSGHDLKDLQALLEQTQGTGINVYTHGEMLPGHGYPELNKYPHLVGNYGGAWQRQGREFEAFPGAVLMTTNCIQEPRDSYKSRIFTCGLVGWPGVQHIEGRDFSPVIEAALAAPGFAEDEPEQRVLVGFGHHAVLGVADKVIDAVKAGQLRHFFLIGGCDGVKPGRNYYTELAEAVPADCLIMTLACGKFRFNKEEFGEVAGLPRLLDIGQCNDAYSAIKIAGALAEAFGCGVNDLPLSLVLSWYEQKAVAILLSLLHLGIKNIRLGPTLPAFLEPEVVQVLVDNYQLTPIGDPAADLAAMLA